MGPGSNKTDSNNNQTGFTSWSMEIEEKKTLRHKKRKTAATGIKPSWTSLLSGFGSGEERLNSISTAIKAVIKKLCKNDVTFKISLLIIQQFRWFFPSFKVSYIGLKLIHHNIRDIKSMWPSKKSPLCDIAIIWKMWQVVKMVLCGTLYHHETCLLIGQNQYSNTYQTNQKGCIRKIVSCATFSKTWIIGEQVNILWYMN